MRPMDALYDMSYGAPSMAKKPEGKASTFRLGAELVVAVGALKARDGILPSEQVRRALTVWLESKGVLKTKRQHGNKHP